jgi:hypothetical protein
MKLWILIAMPLFLFAGLAEQHLLLPLFITALVFFLWFSPAISAIRAFSGRVVQSNLEQVAFKKSVTVKMQKMGARALGSTSDDILAFELLDVSKTEPPIVAIEFVTDKEVGVSYARIFLFNFYAGWGVSSTVGSVIQKSFDDASKDGVSLGFMIFLMLLKLFVINHTGKVNRTIKQLAQEFPGVSAAPNSQTPQSTPKTIRVESTSQQLQSNTETTNSRDIVSQNKVTAGAAGTLLTEEQVTELFVEYEKYENGAGSVKHNPVQIYLTFPEIAGRASKAARYREFVLAAEQEIIPVSINAFIKLVKRGDKFSLMHESTNTEYYQTSSGGIILTKILSSDEDSELSETMSEENVGILLIFSFLGVTASEQAFISIGKELVKCFDDSGIPDAAIEIFEYHDGEQIKIY